jgi:ribosomal protein L7/L12
LTDYKFSNAIFTAALNFIRLAREEEGDMGAARVYAMMDAFDPDLRDEIMLRLIINDTTGPIRIVMQHEGIKQKITAIKEVRSMTRFGLREAKDVLDLADEGRTAIIEGDWTSEQRDALSKSLRGTGYIVV